MRLNYISTSISFLALLLASCGGSDSTSPPIQQPPLDEVVDEVKKTNFSLTLHAESDCGSQPLANTRIHLYSESPIVRPDQAYSEYLTNSAGMLELDLEGVDAVSFSIIAEVDRGYKVYTMNDVAVGRYDMTVLFDGEIDIGVPCECRDKSVTVMDGMSFGIFQDGLFNEDLIWGNGAVNVRTKSVIDVNTVALGVEVCGDSFESMPQLIKFPGAPNESFYYGFNTAQQAKNENPISVIHITERVEKPAKNAEYAVVLSKNINQRTYTYQTAEIADTYFLTFPAFSVGKVTARLISEISGSYNSLVGPVSGQTFFETDIVDILPDEDISDMADFLNGTFLNVALNKADNAVVIEHDFDSQFNQLLINHKYWLDGQVLNWYIYSPEKTKVTLPNPIDDIKPFIEDGKLFLSYVNLKNIDNATSYTDTLVKQRFNYFNQDGERIENPDLSIRSVRLQHADQFANLRALNLSNRQE